MNKSASPTFACLVQEFFTDHMVQQRALSPRTVACYRDSFSLLLGYAEQHLGKPPTALQLIDLDRKFLASFPDHLERDRHNSVRSRNIRLAAIRSFLKFAARRDLANLHLIEQALAVPMKRFDRPMIGFLSREQMLASRSPQPRSPRCPPRTNTVATNGARWVRGTLTKRLCRRTGVGSHLAGESQARFALSLCKPHQPKPWARPSRLAGCPSTQLPRGSRCRQPTHLLTFEPVGSSARSARSHGAAETCAISMGTSWGHRRTSRSNFQIRHRCCLVPTCPHLGLGSWGHRNPRRRCCPRCPQLSPECIGPETKRSSAQRERRLPKLSAGGSEAKRVAPCSGGAANMLSTPAGPSRARAVPAKRRSPRRDVA